MPSLARLRSLRGKCRRSTPAYMPDAAPNRRSASCDLHLASGVWGINELPEEGRTSTIIGAHCLPNLPWHPQMGALLSHWVL